MEQHIQSKDNIEEAESLFYEILSEARIKLNEYEGGNLTRLKAILLHGELKDDALISKADTIKSADELFQHISYPFSCRIYKSKYLVAAKRCNVF